MATPCEEVRRNESFGDPFVDHIHDHLGVFSRMLENELGKQFTAAADLCVCSLRAGGKLMFCGNGGSAADAQHLATELTVRFSKDRAALAALALTTDTSALTAIGNDFGFDHLFSRQVDALCESRDVLLCFSTSGNSKNVVNAVHSARQREAKVIFFGGGDGGVINAMADVSLIVPSSSTARIQEAHITLGHILCGEIEARLGLV